MAEKPLILISEASDAVITAQLVQSAEKAGFAVKTVKADGEALLDAVCRTAPDAVLTNVILPRFDAVEVKKRYYELARRNNALKSKIQFFAMGSFNTPRLEAELSANGFAYYFIYPLDTEYVCERIRRTVMPPKPTLQANDISVLLYRLGMPPHMLGFKYTETAVCLLVADMENGSRQGYSSMLTKRLYPDIAKKYNTTAAAVERSIRTAVSAVFKNNDFKYLNAVFPLYTAGGKKTVSNQRFLITVSGMIYSRRRVKIV